MPHGPLACEEVRLRLASFLEGPAAPPAVAQHLAGCPACRQALFERALSRPPTITAPGDFPAQVIARLGAAPPSGALLYLPVATAAAVVALVAVAPAFPTAPFARWAGRVLELVPQATASTALLAVEGLLCLLGLWRAART